MSMWAVGLRSVVQKSKCRGVGTRGVEGRKYILGVLRSLFGGQPSTVENFCKVTNRHLLWWAYPWASGRGGGEREKKKECVRKTVFNDGFVPSTSRASRTASSALFVASTPAAGMLALARPRPHPCNSSALG